jgi:hypothetical protein
LEEINLSDYLGQVIKFRFKLGSDGGTVADGYYFDDFEILYNVNSPPVAPVASFTTSTNATCMGEAVLFSDGSSNNPSTWAWDFGDGSSASVENPTHAYATAGTYIIALIASNAAGSTSFTDTIVVLTTPQVTLSASDNEVCLTDGVVTLTATANATLSGTGVSNGAFDPTVAGVGSFVITASITDPNGCVGMDTLSIQVDDCANLLNQNISNVLIYPNPTNGEVMITGISAGSTIQLLDYSGKLLHEVEVQSTSMTLDISNFSAGIYMVNCTLASGNVRQLLIKE